MGNSKLPSFPKNQKAKKHPTRKGMGFFESIGEIGKSVTQSIKTDVLQNTAKNIHDQLLGASQGKTPDTPPTPDFDIANWLQLEKEKGFQEGITSERKRRKTQEQVVFNSHERKIQQEIETIRQELQLLAKAVKDITLQTEKAVAEEVVDPGIYHLNFFQQLRSWLEMLRKSIQDGELWLTMWHSRSQKSKYWMNVKKSGTKYMLSGERNVVTQTG